MSDGRRDGVTAPDGGARTGGPGGDPGGGLGRAWNLLVDGLAALGTLLIGVLMVIICCDVVARNVAGGSLPLVSELGALTLVMIVYLQLATTVRHDRLARTELFYGALQERRPRTGAALATLFHAVGAAAIGTMAWSTYYILGKDLASQEYIGVTGVLTLPVWPFRVLILAGLAVASLQLVAQTAGSLLTALGRPGAGR